MLKEKEYEEIIQSLTKLYNDAVGDRNLESWMRERSEQDNHEKEEEIKTLKTEIQVLKQQLYGTEGKDEVIRDKPRNI